MENENAIDRYQRLANATCAPLDPEMLIRLTQCKAAIFGLRAALFEPMQIADAIKKYIFYGKQPPEGIELGLAQEIAMDPRPLEDHAQRVHIVHGILGMISECEEMLGHLTQFSSGIPEDTAWRLTNIKEEQGDFAWYNAIISRATGTPLSEVFNANNRKLLARYKGKFSANQAIVRDIDAEIEALK